MKALLTIAVVLFPTALLQAQAPLTEPPEFPASSPGPSLPHPGDGCFLLATGTIVPGDVDWVQISIPVASTQTIIDVDFPEDTASSALLASIVGGGAMSNIDDNNHPLDDVCGLGSLSDPMGSRQDSAVDFGDTPAGTVIDVGITGGEDFGFTGQHNQNFDYDVWVYVAREPCTGDADCDDGLFCNGPETCVDGVCQDGADPCPGQECDEVNDQCVSEAVVRLDIRPGACPNSFNPNGRGVLPVALLGSADFDAMTIDVSSIGLARADGVGSSVAPHEGPPGPHSVFEDVGTPFQGEPCDCHDLPGDGLVDLSMKFKTDEVAEALQLSDLEPGAVVELVVSGSLLDGTTFTASDCVTIRGPGARPRARGAAPLDNSMEAATATSNIANPPAAGDADSGTKAPPPQNVANVGCGALSAAMLLMTVAAISLAIARRHQSGPSG